jgi:hypothetical protein
VDPDLENIPGVVPDKIFQDYKDNYNIDPVNERFNKKDVKQYRPEERDAILNSNVALPRGDTFIKGRVARHKLASDGTPLGIADRNPILDTREYEVEFTDGTTETYATNLIAENFYSQVDAKGYESLYIDSILEHIKDGSAVSKDNQYTRSYNENMVRLKTTKEWNLLVQLKDGSTCGRSSFLLVDKEHTEKPRAHSSRSDEQVLEQDP